MQKVDVARYKSYLFFRYQQWAAVTSLRCALRCLYRLNGRWLFRLSLSSQNTPGFDCLSLNYWYLTQRVITLGAVPSPEVPGVDAVCPALKLHGKSVRIILVLFLMVFPDDLLPKASAVI
ncbi:MAG: hypothetical protein RL571_472 [Pseudomonadota bacterium]